MAAGWWQELRRRNVVRVGIAYAIVGWVAAQIALMVFETFGAPEWVSKVVLTLILLGFPFALLFAWAFELTSEGLKRTHEVDRGASITKHTGRKVDRFIIAALLVAVVVLAWNQFVNEDTAERVTQVETEAPAPIGGGSKDASIAVLPFVNMSNDPEQEYFSDGISEELLNLLARIPRLKVAARTSSFAFKGRNEDIGQIADTLNVSKVLEGSVRKAGTTLRITAQLIEADTGYHMWSATYDRQLDDVFAIQDEIAAAIVAALEQPLGLTGAAPESVRSASIEAYSAYLEGRQLMELRGQAPLEQSRAAFEKAIGLDPEFAPAYSSLAENLILLNIANYGEIPEHESFELAAPLIERAMQLAPDSADTQVARGFLLDQQQHYDEAIAAYNRAVELNPNMVRALMWRAQVFGDVGRYEEQMASLGKAVALDPLAYVPVQNMSAMHMRRGRTEEAVAAMEKLARIKGDAVSYRSIAAIFSNEGYDDRAHEYLLEARDRAPDDITIAVNFMGVYASLDMVEQFRPLVTDRLTEMWLLFVEDRFDEAVAIGRELVAAEPADSLSIPRWFTGIAHLRAGDPKRALEYFQPFVDRSEGHVGPLFGTGENSLAFDVLTARRDIGDEKGARQLLEALRALHDELAAAGYKDVDTKVRAAQILTLEGRGDEALPMLRELVDAGRVIGGDLMEDYPALDALHEDPGFQQIVADYERERERQRGEILEQLGVSSGGTARPVL